MRALRKLSPESDIGGFSAFVAIVEVADKYIHTRYLAHHHPDSAWVLRKNVFPGHGRVCLPRAMSRAPRVGDWEGGYSRDKTFETLDLKYVV
jgi:hypothetical protein